MPDWVLRFTENVECEKCGTVSEGEFFAESASADDVVEPPIGTHTCPACGYPWTSGMVSWLRPEDARE